MTGIAAIDRLAVEIDADADAASQETKADEDKSNAPDDIDLSHDALATDLGSRSFDQDARHVATWGKWLFWTGTGWQIDDRLDNLTRVRTYLRARADELTVWAEGKAVNRHAKVTHLGGL